MNSIVTFNRNTKGKYNIENNFISIKHGSDAYLLEDELNESQWLHIENNNQASQLLYYPGVVSPKTDNPFEVQSNNIINIKQLNIYYYGLNVTIPEQAIKITTDNTNKDECLYIEIWFQLLNEHTTHIKQYGNQNLSTNIDVEVTDSRLNYPTSQRVQVQTKYIYKTMTDNKYADTTTAIGTFGNIVEADKLYNQLPFENAITLYKEDTNDNNIINKMCAVFPIAIIHRTTSDITQANIENIIQEPVPTFSNVKEDVNNIYTRLTTLEQKLNSIATEVIDDQSAYGISMETQVHIYTGYSSDMYNGTQITSTNFAVNNPSQYGYAITNLGNHYVGQIGELWSYINNDSFYICNTGCKNAVFNTWMFKSDNDEIWVDNSYITSGYNSYTDITINSSHKIKDWVIKDTIIYIIPRYTNKQNTTPSIGDIYYTVLNGSNVANTNNIFSGKKIRVFNTGTNDIPLQILAVNIKSNNITMINQTLDNNTIVNDNYGKHHQIITNDISYGHTQVLVGTPYVASATQVDINVGEIYIEQNNDMFMLNTTSYGDAILNMAVFKTAYDIQGGQG